MASYTANSVVHATLTANTLDTVTLSGQASPTGRIEVVNRSGTDELYFTYGTGITSTPAAPTVGGNDCYVVPAGIGSYEILVANAGAVVKIISASALKYSVIVTGI